MYNKTNKSILTQQRITTNWYFCSWTESILYSKTATVFLLLVQTSNQPGQIYSIGTGTPVIVPGTITSFPRNLSLCWSVCQVGERQHFQEIQRRAGQRIGTWTWSVTWTDVAGSFSKKSNPVHAPVSPPLVRNTKFPRNLTHAAIFWLYGKKLLVFRLLAS